jgi:hypothetical protein
VRITSGAADHKLGIILGEDFPPSKHTIAVDGIEFAQSRAAPSLMGGDKRRTGSAEKIEHDAATARHVLDGVGYHRNWLDGRVKRKLIEPASLQGIDASIFPDVGPVAPVLPGRSSG